MSLHAPRTGPLHGVSLGIDHLTLPVSDLELAERFYVDLLGAEFLERFDAETFLRFRPDRANELENPRNSPLHVSVRLGHGPRLDLFLQAFGQPGLEQAHPHIAFAVAGPDLDRVKNALEAAGVPTDGPRRLGPPGQASLYFMDPFGNNLEFMTSAYPGSPPVGAPDWKRLAYQWKA
ncbi:VOC family protein [Stigmatella aurantiaca]|uniref:1,2-dihydroxynaphthalene dioxygenase n=1 Tax=Stigmatella aurantiaca (strain DW4/3-1) TaxID=378806 RepID=Q08UR1_STIAD|nr:VOC family protein [Stigmatella aurantiaca]ADO70821.1 Glutathione transferase [Stigmatella aurantiaca DW4/3-1]EAU64200.1 1,2-dihydroxynaphthalene dioxygenase [Stigmatella aurantiaca DW4/3-1]